MSQVDTLNYFSLLCWFILYILLLYIIVLVILVPIIYSVLKIRSIFLLKLEKLILFYECMRCNLEFLLYCINKHKNIYNFYALIKLLYSLKIFIFLNK